MADKKKFTKITTPKGRLKFPRLDAPDTKFDPDGAYSTKFLLKPEEAKNLIAQIDAEAKAAYAEAVAENKGKKVKQADLPYSMELDKETGEETGDVVINFKLKAVGGSKKPGKKTWVQKPRIFDAKGTPLVNVPKIGGGTVAKVSAELMPFYVPAVGAGVSLRLQAVQILTLVEFGGGGNATSYGFESEEGFEAQAAEGSTEFPPEESAVPASTSTSDGADF